MEDFFNWIATNKAWLFEGLGVAIILGIFGFIWKKRKMSQDMPTTSNKATGNRNIQAGRDVNIQKDEKKN